MLSLPVYNVHLIKKYFSLLKKIILDWPKQITFNWHVSIFYQFSKNLQFSSLPFVQCALFNNSVLNNSVLNNSVLNYSVLNYLVLNYLVFSNWTSVDITFQLDWLEAVSATNNRHTTIQTSNNIELYYFEI